MLIGSALQALATSGKFKPVDFGQIRTAGDTFDQFARIEPVRINAGPPFSALFTLWLSMMQAVGLASRSTFSRHSTYSA
jgi:hypothetical protein